MTDTKNPFSTGDVPDGEKATPKGMNLGGDFGRHKGLLEVLQTSEAADINASADAGKNMEGYGG
jgi:hypothetical protein